MLFILSSWLIQFCLYLDLTFCIPAISSSFLMTSLLILSSLVYPLTLLRKRISAASRRVTSRFVIIQTSCRILNHTSTHLSSYWLNQPYTQCTISSQFCIFILTLDRYIRRCVNFCGQNILQNYPVCRLLRVIGHNYK